MIEAATFALGIAIGLLIKGINININHKNEHVDKPVDDGYNPSVGDPEAVLYLDRQHGGE